MNLKLGTAGFTLLEVLVALLVLSLGLLGLAALQTTSLAFNTDSYTRTQATMIAYDIIDRMRANPTAVFDGLYDVGDHATAVAKISAYKDCVDDDCNCDAAACITTEDLALYDLGRWYARLSRPDVLPEATKNYSTIERNGSEVTVTIRWIDRGIPAFQRWVAEIPAWN